MDFADADRLHSKIIHYLDLNGPQDVHAFRQSGNVGRTIEELGVNDVIKQISSTMTLAKIGLVTIRGDENRLEIYL